MKAVPASQVPVDQSVRVVVHYVIEAIALLFVLALLMLFARRARIRSADSDARLRRDIAVGTQVMTTSGLYGTVVAINTDDTVILSVAPGVEVRWAFAALRDAAALPPRYRRPVDAPVATAETPRDGYGGRP